MQNTAILLQAKSNFDSSDGDLMQKLQACEKSILLDVSAVEQTQAHTLNLLVNVHERLRKYGQTLTLISPSACIRTWLYVTKLQQVIPVFSNLLIANAYVQQIQKQDHAKSHS